MRRLLNDLYRLSGWLAAASVAGICVLVCAQVALNVVDALSSALIGHSLGLSIPSYAELAGFLLAAASFLALAPTWRSGGHIRVTLVLHRLGRRQAHWAEVWALAIAAAMTTLLAYYVCALALESWHFGDVSPGLVAVPLWLPQSAMALGLIILAVAQVDSLIEKLGTSPGQERPYPSRAASAFSRKDAADTARRPACCMVSPRSPSHR